MKNLKHKVQINVADCSGRKERVVTSTSMLLPKRLMKMLFGEFSEVLVLTPGKSVAGIEIRQIGNGGAGHAEAE
ncbi:MAG: hypothetical protein LKE44_09990 [Eubacterium sp.]|jgi:bisphosphoglycerate-independent phosphoglycerate mutase (AlkP superfamily)|nr:hypothetical protein [Eubacterium sp.]